MFSVITTCVGNRVIFVMEIGFANSEVTTYLNEFKENLNSEADRGQSRSV